jgi:mRNA interferase MazF
MSLAILVKTFIRQPTVTPLIQADEIYLASFPFGDTAGMKLRPVLTLTAPIGPVPEILVAYISSVLPNPMLPSDIVLDSGSSRDKSTNLKTKSVLRLHKLATIHAGTFVRRLGHLSTGMIPRVDQTLRKVLNL